MPKAATFHERLFAGVGFRQAAILYDRAPRLEARRNGTTSVSGVLP